MSRHSWNFRDLSGQRFSRLVVLSGFGKTTKTHQALWQCRCDCGKEFVAAARNLLAKETRSCGCLKREIDRVRGIRHGASHKRESDSVYHRWKSMKQRCLNPKERTYRHYGGRGIKICETWQGKDGFVNYRNCVLSLASCPGQIDRTWQVDRVDNNGNYEPGNVQWVRAKENCQNRRLATITPEAEQCLRDHGFVKVEGKWIKNTTIVPIKEGLAKHPV